MTPTEMHIAALEEKIEKLKARSKVLEEALESISKNSCCGQCQEAKFVSISALENYRKEEL